MELKVKGREFVLLGIIGLFLIIFFYRECNRPAPVADHSKYDSAMAIISADSIEKIKMQEAYEDSITKINVEKGQVEIRANKLETQLDISVARSRELAYQLKDARDLIEDTGMIAFHPSYVDACDSCADQLLYQSALVVAYKEELKKKDEIHERELAVRDTALAHEQRSNEKEDEAIELLKRGYHEMARKFKPATKFYAGGKMFGSKETFVEGTGFSGILATKNGKAWTFETGMLNSGRQYFALGAHFLISFRKR